MGHTPGPWRQSGGWCISALWNESTHTFMRTVATLPSWGYLPFRDNSAEKDANAALIAASPLLLAELESIRDDMALLVREKHIEFYNFERIDAAIAAAKPEE